MQDTIYYHGWDDDPQWLETINLPNYNNIDKIRLDGSKPLKYQTVEWETAWWLSHLQDMTYVPSFGIQIPSRDRVFFCFILRLRALILAIHVGHNLYGTDTSTSWEISKGHKALSSSFPRRMYRLYSRPSCLGTIQKFLTSHLSWRVVGNTPAGLVATLAGARRSGPSITRDYFWPWETRSPKKSGFSQTFPTPRYIRYIMFHAVTSEILWNLSWKWMALDRYIMLYPMRLSTLSHEKKWRHGWLRKTRNLRSPTHRGPARCPPAWHPYPCLWGRTQAPEIWWWATNQHLAINHKSTIFGRFGSRQPSTSINHIHIFRTRNGLDMAG